MNAQRKIEDVATPAVAACVRAYLLARVAAEAMRKAVDAIGAEMLAIYPLHNKRNGKRITDAKKDWLAFVSPDGGEEWREWHGNCVHEQEKRGLRAGLTDRSHCPALVLENLRNKVEALLIDVSGKPFGVNSHNILCQSGGLEKRQRWIELVCGLVINHPAYAGEFENLLENGGVA